MNYAEESLRLHGEGSDTASRQHLPKAGCFREPVFRKGGRRRRDETETG